MTIQVKSDAEPIEIEADAYLPTEYGNFRVSVTLDEAGKEHSLLYTGDLSGVGCQISPSEDPLGMPHWRRIRLYEM